MASERIVGRASELTEQVRGVLHHLYDPTYLQTHPLARALSFERQAGKSSNPGKDLRQALLDAIETLHPGQDLPSGVSASRIHQLLHLRYVEGLDTAEVARRLAIGKSEYYRDLRRGIAALALLLEERLRLEERTDARPGADAASETDTFRTGVIPKAVALPTGTVTFLCTDLEGSTRPWEHHPKEMRRAIERHDAILREAIEDSGGVVFRTQGDGLCAAFPTASQAVAAALLTQQALLAESWGKVGELRVRMALHAGAVEVRNGDYVGACLNRAGRLLALAHGGQVLVSDVVSDLASDSLPEGASLRDLGEHRLRDLIRAEHVYQLVHPKLPTDFPPLKSLDAYPTNLPIQLTSFVGREREMAEIRRLLGATRLLTLTGTGGCGKTRLAYQVAAELLDEYADGVWVVELASLANPELVPGALAAVLGLRQQPGQPILATLQSYLKARHLLLLLDNCEHLLDASASLADSLLKACPKLTVLATSREALGIAGETRYRVPSLSLPDREKLPFLESLLVYESVRLFIERGAAVQPSFALTEQNARLVAEVCSRLDGIPLAIELAAALVRGLTVEQIARRLDDRFRVLASGSRTALPRQQTLRATIDWSHDLLSAPERVLFRRLAVFAGGFSLEATEGVCGDEGESTEVGTSEEVRIERGQVLDLLLRLVDRSLVVAEESVAGERYRLLETVREYAWQRLSDAGELSRTRDRHRAWYQLYYTDLSPLVGVYDIDRLRLLLALERDNLRAALSWCLETDATIALRLATLFSVRSLWHEFGFTLEGRYWLREVIARVPERGVARAWALEAYYTLVSDQGDLDEAESAAEELLEIARELGDLNLTIYGLMDCGEVARLRGDYGRAKALHEEARASARRLEDAQAVLYGVPIAWAVAAPSFWLGIAHAAEGNYQAARDRLEEALGQWRARDYHAAAFASALLGFLEQIEGSYSTARSLLEESVESNRRVDDQPALGWAIFLLGYTLARDGEHERGVSLLRESLVRLRKMGHRLRLGQCLCLLGIVEGDRGAPARAVRLIGAGVKLFGQARPEWFASERVDREACLATARSALGDEAFARAWAQGNAMTLEEAVEYALSDDE